jgi:hypothetical protein
LSAKGLDQLVFRFRFVLRLFCKVSVNQPKRAKDLDDLEKSSKDLEELSRVIDFDDTYWFVTLPKYLVF